MSNCEGENYQRQSCIFSIFPGEPGDTTTTRGRQVTAAGAVVGACAVLAIAMSVGLLYKARRHSSQAGYSVLQNID